MFRASLQANLARLLSSRASIGFKRLYRELLRRLWRREHIVDVYLKIDDPYSYLLVQALPDLQRRFAAKFHYYVVQSLPSEMYPERELWQAHSLVDSELLAKLYGFEPPNQNLNFSPEVLTLATQELQKASASHFLEEALAVFHQFWQAGSVTQSHKESYREIADKRLVSKGHYLSASMHYNGEWFWGVDRLVHLEKRLNQLRLNIGPKTEVYVRTRLMLAEYAPPSGETLTMYFSARSPYSYLGLVQAHRLCQKAGLQLEVKPVLPMMMRGMSVPPVKKWYIFFDTVREARFRNIEYGYVADPLGKGVERCYALIDFAQNEGRLTEYLLSFAASVNAKGVRSETDSGLKQIVENAGLDWKRAKLNLANQSWREEVAYNYDEMHSFGKWGVPCFRFRNQTFWGQDRLVFIEKMLTSHH